MTDRDELSADEVIARFALAPHPEGGHYRETFRDAAPDGQRPASTAILFLLKAGEQSHWHRVDAVEIWHHYAGSPLALEIAPSGGPLTAVTLGSNIAARQLPQAVVPRHHWQRAKSLGGWTLVGCTVAPAFSFDGFELAPPRFDPRDDR